MSVVRHDVKLRSMQTIYAFIQQKKECYKLLTQYSTIFNMFNRLLETTIDDIVTENEEAVLKTVGAGLRTDRQTHTHKQTHRHDQFYDSCPSPDGQL